MDETWIRQPAVEQRSGDGVRVRALQKIGEMPGRQQVGRHDDAAARRPGLDDLVADPAPRATEVPDPDIPACLLYTSPSPRDRS